MGSIPTAPTINLDDSVAFAPLSLDFLGRNRPIQGRGKDYYLHVEGFLLHYRNLIEFFGNHGGLRAGSPEVWSPRTLSDDEVTSIVSAGLLDEYHGPISRYLGHCDEIRAEKDRAWQHIEMYAKIEHLLRNFRKLFPSQQRSTGSTHSGSE